MAPGQQASAVDMAVEGEEDEEEEGLEAATSTEAAGVVDTAASTRATYAVAADSKTSATIATRTDTCGASATNYLMDGPLLKAKRAEEQEKGEEKAVEAVAVAEIRTLSIRKVTLHSLDYWVIDSGATYSMTPRADLLTELEPSPVKHVTSALGQRAEVKGMGKAMFKDADGKMVGLKNMLWVPNLTANLISVRHLQKVGMDTSSKGAKTYTARIGEQLSIGSTTTRQSSLVNGGEEGKDAEEEEEEVQQVRERAPILPSPQRVLHGRGKRRFQAPNRLTYDAPGKQGKSALAGAAMMVGDNEESGYEECAFVFFSPVEMPGEPATLMEALESSDADEWKNTMESELKRIEEKDTWEWVELPEGRKAITSKWLFKINSDADGKIQCYKSRLAAKGYQQKEKVDFKELFVLVVKPTMLRTAGATLPFAFGLLSVQVAASFSTKGEAVGSGYGVNDGAKAQESTKCKPGGTSKQCELEESGAAAKEQHKGEENPKAAAEEENGESMWGTIARAAFSNPTSATGECDWLTLHRRMGHVALPILQQLVKNKMVAGIRVKGGQMSSDATAKAPLDEVVMDVVVPLELGAAQAEYFLTIVDVYTRMTWVYVLSKKSDVAETVKTDWLPMVERQQDQF
ncbi:unnamed protein product [Closterium sp. NIES-53]